MQRSPRTIAPLLAATSVGVALALVACRREEQTIPLSDKVVAVVEGAIISPEALIEEVLRLGYTNGWEDAVESCLEEMIRSEAIYAKARDEGFDRSPRVQAAVQSNLLSGSQAESNQTTRSEVLKQVVVARFLETHLGLDANGLQISDSEIQAYFRKNPNEFSTPPLANGAMIFVRVPAGSSPETLEALKKRAESIRTTALGQKELRDFASLVEQHSDDPGTRNHGGNMGWLRQDATNQWTATVLRALFALREPGDVSPVVATPDGFYVLRLIKRRPESVAQWAEVRERIRTKLAERKEAERANQFFASLKAALRIQINRQMVEAVKQQLKTNAPSERTVSRNP